MNVRSGFGDLVRLGRRHRLVLGCHVLVRHTRSLQQIDARDMLGLQPNVPVDSITSINPLKDLMENGIAGLIMSHFLPTLSSKGCRKNLSSSSMGAVASAASGSNIGSSSPGIA